MGLACILTWLDRISTRFRLIKVSSDLNVDNIHEVLYDWPDQELVGFLLDGVQFRANLPLQFVFGLQLGSLSNAWNSVQAEIIRLKLILPTMIFIMSSITLLVASRKLEPYRHRRTSDGGFPRQEAIDSSGIRARSLNQAIGLHYFAVDT